MCELKEENEMVLWSRLGIEPKKTNFRGIPIVTCNTVSGRIHFNAAACHMIPEVYFCKFAEILHKKERNGGQEVLGIRLVQDYPCAGSFRINKVMRNQKICGCTIYSLQLAKYIKNNRPEDILHFPVKVSEPMLFEIPLTKVIA